jgi:iron complex transport system ATP-binding protein
MLARALAQDTPILMLDEPTAHLDLPSRIRLMRLLHTLARQTHKGILLSTHDLDLALQVADEVWLLHSSGVLHKGTPEDLVLNGVFEAAFAEEDVAFDKEAGTFIIHTQPGKPVLFTGEGVPAFWTQRALRRAGFILRPTSQKDIHEDILYHLRLSNRDGRVTWLLEGGPMSGEYDSIEKLLRAMA